MKMHIIVGCVTLSLTHREALEMMRSADTNGVVGGPQDPGTYDDEMLNAHFITGDGRGNENIALTAVHSVFHSEHNRVVDANKITILQSGDLAFLNEWLVTDVASLPVIAPGASDADIQAIANTLVWDGERLFQAARFSTEMQYQHLVFEEFARRIQPMVDPFVFNNSPEIDPAITAEFAHTVYRFGHSMLTGTVDRLDNNLNLLNGDQSQQTLLAMFLNPQAYLASGTDAATINANLVRGLTRDVGSAMDEMIVVDVRSQLLGLPLDLGALNIARGRDTGIPSLNETRRQLYNSTGLADLKPYTSWVDFAGNIKNATAIINFIAAYGTHATITGGEHVVIGGTEGNDILTSDKGDDTLWGDGGNDYINGGAGADNVFGGEGDDIIEDPFGDDMLRGAQGNDVIASARGLDLIFGDQGSDYIVLGQDAS